ncbi:hypothetical protein AAC387_Pa07g2968 [Persea americana]
MDLSNSHCSFGLTETIFPTEGHEMWIIIRGKCYWSYSYKHFWDINCLFGRVQLGTVNFVSFRDEQV